MTFTFGKDFKIQVFGESHGEGVGVVVEGVPPGIAIDKSLIQMELERRRPGSSALSSSRAEKDPMIIHSGVFNGKSNGAPIAMTIPNIDVDSSVYEEIRHTPRPGHADYTARAKFRGFNDYRGGGFLSGRITAAFVMAGALARHVLNTRGIQVLTHVTQIGKVTARQNLTNEDIKQNVFQTPIRCADLKAVSKMESEIINARNEGDSVGGVIECRVIGVPVGLGEPIFDSVESVISHSMFSIPGVKGIEFGSGFTGSSKRGSENNDSPIIVDGEIQWAKNDSGGVLGGITNGAPVVFRVAVKPTASISKKQQTVDLEKMEETWIEIKGRHDPSIVPRAVPVVECLTAIVMVDLMKRDSSLFLGKT
jgi:chorismate synthase